MGFGLRLVLSPREDSLLSRETLRVVAREATTSPVERLKLTKTSLQPFLLENSLKSVLTVDGSSLQVAKTAVALICRLLLQSFVVQQSAQSLHHLVDILIPSSLAGFFIGANGEHIQDLRKRLGVHVRVIPLRDPLYPRQKLLRVQSRDRGTVLAAVLRIIDTLGPFLESEPRSCCAPPAAGGGGALLHSLVELCARHILDSTANLVGYLGCAEAESRAKPTRRF